MDFKTEKALVKLGAIDDLNTQDAYKYYWFNEILGFNNQIVTLLRQEVAFGGIIGWSVRLINDKKTYNWIPEIWLRPPVIKSFLGLCDNCGGINKHEEFCKLKD